MGYKQWFDVKNIGTEEIVLKDSAIPGGEYKLAPSAVIGLLYGPMRRLVSRIRDLVEHDAYLAQQQAAALQGVITPSQPVEAEEKTKKPRKARSDKGVVKKTAAKAKKGEDLGETITPDPQVDSTVEIAGESAAEVTTPVAETMFPDPFAVDGEPDSDFDDNDGEDN